MRPYLRRCQSHSIKKSQNASSLFYSPRLEALEDRLTPAATFYWKLASASPVVDPDHALSSWNYTHTGVDPISGSYSEKSNLTMGHAPDQAAYSYVYSAADGSGQTTKVSAAWSGAPGIIVPGQVFTISDSLLANSGPNASARVSVSAYGLTVHGLSGVKLDLFTKSTGQQFVEGSGMTSGAVSFTAPKTQNADFPNPVGVTPNKPVAHLVIFENFGFLGNTGANVVEYMYDQVVGTPPQLGFAAPPVGAPVGQALAPVVLSMTNAPAGSIVTLALGEKPEGAMLSGSLTAPVVNGQATFKNLSLNVPGNYTLVASSLGLTATSRQIQIGDQLKFVVQPLKYVLGTNAITVSVEGIAPNGKVDPLLKLSDVELKLLKDGVSSPIQAAAKVTNGVIQYTLSLASPGQNLQLTASSAKALTNATSTTFSDVLNLQSVWTGNGTKVAGGNANWGNPLNWDIGQAPQSGAGQSLIFPANAINKAPIDNMPKPADMDRFTVGDITIAGNYRISGTQALTVVGDIAISQGPDAHLAIADLLFANPTMLTAGTGSRLTLEGTKGIAGQTLTVEGAGIIVLNSPVADDVLLSGGANGTGNLEFGSKLQGKGRIMINGGTLASGASNSFAGSIQITAGTIRFATSSAAKPLESPLGIGSIVLAPAGGTITFDPGKAGYAKLANNTTFDLQGGKASLVLGTVFFLKPVLIKSPGALDTATGAVFGITDVSSGTALDSLTLTGAGTTNFVGTLGATAIVEGRAKLSGKFAGTGRIVLTKDASVLESTQANTFRGTIEVQKGSLLIGGASPLGTGDLDLGGAGQAVSVKVATPATLANEHVVLDGVGVTVQPSTQTKGNPFNLTVAEVVQLKNASTLSAPAGTNSINLKGAITGAALTLNCTAIMGGTLSAPINIPAGGTVALDTKFGGTGNLSVQGGLLSSVNNLKSYTGSVIVSSGVIALGSATANLGVGALSLMSGTLRLPVAIATLTNASIQLGGTLQISAYSGATPTPVAGGKLKIAAPIIFGAASEIDPLAGTIVTLNGPLTGSVKVGGKGEVDRSKSFQVGDLANSVFTILAGAKLKYI